MSKAFFRYPALFKNFIAFVSQDDLWLFDQTHKVCRRLTQGIGSVSHPYFSPDGRHLAFSCSQEGALEVYVMPAQGGELTRLTHHGEQAIVCGWSGLDNIIYASSHQSGFRQNSLYQVSLLGGMSTVIEVGSANYISFGTTSDCMVIQRHGYGYPSWKRYQGGLAAEMWIKDGPNKVFQPFAPRKHNTLQPIWHRDRVYYLSDFQGHGNIYSNKIDGSDPQRHTHHEGFYVRHMSIHDDTIVYACGGDLWVCSTKNASKPHKLAIELHSFSPQSSRKFVSDGYRLESAELNNDGSQIALTNRGRLFVMPTWAGGSINLGKTSGVRYRSLCWLHSKKLAVICDQGKEEVLCVFQTHSNASPKIWAELDIGRVLSMQASPIEDVILIANHRHELLLCDLTNGTLQTIDHSKHANFSGFDFSPDGKWLVYSKACSHDTAQIILFKIDGAQKTSITTGQYADYSPQFDPAGKYIYFLSQRALSPKMDELCFRYSFHNTSIAYACCLQDQTTDPFLPTIVQPSSVEDSSDGKTPENQEAENSPEAKDTSVKKDSIKPVQIDLDAIEQRICQVPIDAGRYTKILTLTDKILFITAGWHDDESDDLDHKGQIMMYDMREHKTEHIYDGISDASLSKDRTWALYYHNHKLRALRAGTKTEPKDDSYRKGGWINLRRACLRVTPPQEWLFMFTESWRLQQDFFWDKDMGQVDWQAVYQNYLPLAKKVSTRAELSDVIAEMQGELGSSHAYVWGGDAPETTFFPQGHLGADFIYDKNSKHWHISHIYNAEVGTPAYQSPLCAPGLNLNIGDQILAVNGEKVSAHVSPESLLIHRANCHITLTVMCKSTNKKRDVTVKTRSSMKPLHYRNWVEKNRRYVSEKTQGKIGYIHIPDMSKRGFSEFTRSYLQCFDCDGLIVDVRFNGGGNVSSLILQHLALKRFGLDSVRWLGSNLSYPIASPKGNMVALCNEQAGSDGDMFSHAFKAMGLGPLLGKRTWGGVIGINVRNSLLDGGMTSQPEYAVWFSGVGYGIENHGVDPDEVIEITPEQAAKDHDIQLDRAISVALSQVKKKDHPDLDSMLDQTPKPVLKSKPLPQGVCE